MMCTFGFRWCWFGFLVWLTAVSAVRSEVAWTEFRGPTGQGIAKSQNLPTSWSDSENVAWKVDVPGLGWSSPVYANGIIWLTSAVDDGKSLRLLGYRLEDGQQVHDIEVFANSEPKSIHKKNSHASPTPVIDQGRIFVHFGTYGTACVTTDGKIQWKTKFDYEPMHGPGGSPIVYQNLLILACDGTDVQFVVAVDKRTGKEVWRTKRTHASEERLSGAKMPPMAFSTPLLIQQDGVPQVISAGGDHVAAYHAETGQEIWFSRYDGYSVVPRPVIGKGHVFVSSSYDGPVFYAIRLGGQGDVTDSHVAWTLEKGAPHNPSAIVVGNEVYVVNDKGIATCLDIASGKEHWQKRLGGNFSASPLYADGKLYFLNEEGETTILRPGTTYDEIAKPSLNERTLASIAPLDGGLLIRGETHLFRIGK
ncbi:MAG: PQQ-binding-like beta-propeller repeat protein [Pirellulaceae bacterium]